MSIILFIFVAGSIIIFGEQMKKSTSIQVIPSQNDILATENKKTSAQNISTITNLTANTPATPPAAISDVNNSSGQNNAPVIDNTPAPAPVIVHPTTKTRAS